MSDVQSSCGDRDATRARAAQLRVGMSVAQCSQARIRSRAFSERICGTQDYRSARGCFSLEVVKGAPTESRLFVELP